MDGGDCIGGERGQGWGLRVGLLLCCFFRRWSLDSDRDALLAYWSYSNKNPFYHDFMQRTGLSSSALVPC